jgi:hypothetical protein
MKNIFLKCNNASIAMIFSLTMIPVVGIVSFGMDYSKASSYKTRLQAAVDAGAVAGMSAQGNLTNNQRQNIAQSILNSNLVNSELINVVANIIINGNVLTINATADSPNNLSRFFSYNKTIINAVSQVSVTTNTISSNENVCILVKSPTANQALLVNSGANITASNCRMDVLSTASPAAIFNASSNMNFTKTCVAGETLLIMAEQLTTCKQTAQAQPILLLEHYQLLL